MVCFVALWNFFGEEAASYASISPLSTCILPCLIYSSLFALSNAVIVVLIRHLLQFCILLTSVLGPLYPSASCLRYFRLHVHSFITTLVDTPPWLPVPSIFSIPFCRSTSFWFLRAISFYIYLLHKKSNVTWLLGASWRLFFDFDDISCLYLYHYCRGFSLDYLYIFSAHCIPRQSCLSCYSSPSSRHSSTFLLLLPFSCGCAVRFSSLLSFQPFFLSMR